MHRHIFFNRQQSFRADVMFTVWFFTRVVFLSIALLFSSLTDCEYILKWKKPNSDKNHIFKSQLHTNFERNSYTGVVRKYKILIRVLLANICPHPRPSPHKHTQTSDDNRVQTEPIGGGGGERTKSEAVLRKGKRTLGGRWTRTEQPTRRGTSRTPPGRGVWHVRRNGVTRINEIINGRAPLSLPPTRAFSPLSRGALRH